MFELDITKSFSAAHELSNYNGPCANLHGHNWNVQVFVMAENLNEIGIALDFRKLKAELGRILERYDHHCLNDLPEFKNENPTSENIAKHIYHELSDLLNQPGLRVSKVRVCESDSSGAAYWC